MGNLSTYLAHERLLGMAAEALVVLVQLHRRAGRASRVWVALPGSGDEARHCLQELHAGGCRGTTCHSQSCRLHAGELCCLISGVSLESANASCLAAELLLAPVHFDAAGRQQIWHVFHHAEHSRQRLPLQVPTSLSRPAMSPVSCPC